MRILYLAPEFPFPPERRSQGLRLKTYHQLVWLQKRHSIDLVTFGDREDRAALRKFERKHPRIRVLALYPVRQPGQDRLQQVLHHLRTLEPLWSFAKWEPRLAEVLRGIPPDRYDLAFFDDVQMMFYSRYLSHPVKVLDYSDAASLRSFRGALSSGLSFRGGKDLYASFFLLLRETLDLPNFSCVRMVNTPETLYLRRVTLGRVDPKVIPLTYPTPRGGRRPRPSRGGLLATSSADMSTSYLSRSLLDFFREQWPALRQRVPDLRFELALRNMTPSQTRTLEGIPGLTVFPWVKDYAAFLRGSDLCVYFDQGGTGIKNRVLQALCLGRPVAAYTSGFMGLPVTHGRDCLMAKDARELEKAVETLARGKDLRSRLGANAAKTFSGAYDPDRLEPLWDSFLQEAFRKAGRAGAPR